MIVNPNDTKFNNYYVSPVSLSLDFSKKLIGRPLKADEFDFVLKDEQGKEVARTKTRLMVKSFSIIFLSKITILVRILIQ